MEVTTTLTPEYLIVDGQVHQNWALEYDHQGLITYCGPKREQDPACSHPNQCLTRGLVNCHSHSFQRMIRGRVERRNPARPHDDFWSWRQQMYQAAQQYTPEELEVIATWTFLEMLESGITHVGEFHYVHHQPDGTSYPNHNETALAIARAADKVGIGLTLIRAVYLRAGFERELEPAQKRFIDTNLEFSLESIRSLIQQGLSVAVAPHSIRAVPAPQLEKLGAFARKYELPLHIHASEQTGELLQSQAEYGLSPIELLQRHQVLGPHTTLVHAIHLSEADRQHIINSNSLICSCPTTERNLGDGIVDSVALQQAGVRLCLGSDSNCQINLLEDARQLEYHQRLKLQQRAVHKTKGTIASQLWQCATRNGDLSLRLTSRELKVGAPATFLLWDLTTPELAGVSSEYLLDQIVFSASPVSIAQVMSQGTTLVSQGCHRKRESFYERFATLTPPSTLPEP